MEKEANYIIESCQDELRFKTSRSSGAGGQHVNKVETKVTLRWDIKASAQVTTDQKAQLVDKIGNYINKEGVLTISDESTRSQLKNKEKVVAKWRNLINKAFQKKKKRKKTNIPKSVKKARLKAKRNRSEVKKLRQKPGFDG
ncbi:alternative ribosome rescue aminoacyl-tRNA hydrolase ArfB [Portibacter marinus]|uniref:alternative ribosome rescue aminoacyl-tRNA hydrolase ArfB n=1 Tax=Portibacter marinus TaxID=2898660 RepID=UPI001F388E99|nr:alternative ribosome rescue aminoacyl-tRNA hydrolase ArfB [Portibacter marinus]